MCPLNCKIEIVIFIEIYVEYFVERRIEQINITWQQKCVHNKSEEHRWCEIEKESESEKVVGLELDGKQNRTK